ncbi:hypothetical protein UY416_09655 [Paenibacillus polymyxa]|uniref:hypothetical protein n=1 Tax=Paenibacillus polymyxa TaxID=1406 RepID=UPI000FAD5245|nr:hypothetical protein [Paenibacillus polymyxa]MDY8046558.1 hypothetical protein [Paenibacillus polymyxa]
MGINYTAKQLDMIEQAIELMERLEADINDESTKESENANGVWCQLDNMRNGIDNY